MMNLLINLIVDNKIGNILKIDILKLYFII